MSTKISSGTAPQECLVATAAAEFGERPAFEWDGGDLSFAGLDARVSTAAGRLKSRGFSRGEPIGIWSENGINMAVAFLALVRLGCIAVPVSTRLPARSALEALRRVGINRLLLGPRQETSSFSLESNVDVVPLESLSSDVPSISRAAATGLDPTCPCCAVFTSGSSGEPRAAALTLSSLYFSAVGSNRNISLSEGDSWLLSLPLYHVGGLGILMRCLVGGAAVYFPRPGGDPLDALRGDAVSHVSVVPTQLQRMLRKRLAVDRMKAILVGGGPIPEGVLADSARRGAPIHLTYGLTEMASQVTTTPAGAVPETSTDAGTVLPFRSVRIDATGEILVRGETLFAGHLAGGEVQEATEAEGWFRTGDVGRFDADEHLRVMGRRDNMFISGGENIYPEEIESAIMRIPGVDRAVVVDVPDAEYGARPVAFVASSGREVALVELRSHLEETLPRFKHPVAMYTFPEGAELSLAKPDRRRLREIASRHSAS